ncbi:MAG: hypothetical protein KDA54_06995 [Phycisphaerales bacterium]|nr:hypothetical protein [Phycisphaerales bacterium]
MNIVRRDGMLRHKSIGTQGALEGFGMVMNSNSRPTIYRRAINIVAIVFSLVMVAYKAFRSDWLETLHFVQYAIPPIIFSALLVTDRLSGRRDSKSVKLVLDGLALAIAGSRLFTTATPFSGHMVLFAYGLLAAENRTTRLIALLLLIHTTVLKLIVWADFSTWSYGAAMGVVLGIACLKFSSRAESTHDRDDR